MSTIVLGIDPGYCNTGWVAVDVARDVPVGAGLIRTQRDNRTVLKHDDTWRRVQQLARQLEGVMGVYRPRALVVEAPMGSQSAAAAAAMATAYTLLACLAHHHDVPAVRVQAADAKLSAAGSRAASKGAVEAGVRDRWPDLYPMAEDAVGQAKTKVEHIYDAAACVWAAWDSNVVRMARRGSA